MGVASVYETGREIERHYPPGQRAGQYPQSGSGQDENTLRMVTDAGTQRECCGSRNAAELQ